MRSGGVFHAPAAGGTGPVRWRRRAWGSLVALGLVVSLALGGLAWVPARGRPPVLTAAGIRFRYLGLVPYAELTRARASNRWSVAASTNPFRTLRVGACGTDEVVVLERRTGWFRQVVVCPTAPDAFLRTVNARAAR